MDKKVIIKYVIDVEAKCNRNFKDVIIVSTVELKDEECLLVQYYDAYWGNGNLLAPYKKLRLLERSMKINHIINR